MSSIHDIIKSKKTIKTKKRKRYDKIDDIRLNYPFLIEKIFNDGNKTYTLKKLIEVCTNNCFIITRCNNNNPYGPNYREVHGTIKYKK